MRGAPTGIPSASVTVNGKPLTKLRFKDNDQMTTKSTEERALLQHVIKTETDVPLQVFNVNFSTYLFFDNDICHSHDLINAIKSVVS